ncbi:hypothetical protein BLX42_22515 [Pseudomonas sp. SG-MS2]|uniref:hypothetical protein n=1 Tax=Pseudomonas sp. SG-MS2 TaxID=1914534 RepID=UPI00137B0A35|nr:hypothetical protein [Pseudomonas sp. SG-MS2]KAF1307007.1 hypothetical protein BLX42_22515 [Pseudomonas sp. SG-MS2]
MDTNKMREQFEAAYTAYCEKFGWKTYTAFHMLSEVYVKESTELAWQMWQASREAVLVELQAEIDDYVRERREAIEAQGLKVAP